MGDEGRLPLVAIFDMDIVIPPSNVELSEVTSIFQLVNEVGNEGKGIGVVGGVFVEVLVILARMKFSILLFNKEERGCLRRVRRADLSNIEVS